MGKERILLVHLMANGDCLMATTIARQIKEDFPGSHLTWAIGYKSRHVIENNPHVDQIWSVEHAAHELLHDDVWRRTKEEAEQRRARGEFDRVYYTQIFPENFNNFDGTTRTSIFRSYPGKITVPISPVIRLHDHEIERVKAFAETHGLAERENVVIFECAPGSHQSPLTPELAIRIARRVVSGRSDTAFIISSHHSFTTDNGAIIDASVLSYRENAELSKYATLLLGGSSGITWLLTSEWAKRLPTIQFLQKSPAWYSFASVKYDHQFFGLDTSHILETDLKGEDEIADLVNRYLDQKTFVGLRERLFRPSIDQIYGLYEMMQSRVEVGRVLGNFMARNPSVPVSSFRFYRGLASLMLRLKVRALARPLVGRLRRAVRGNRPNAKPTGV